MKKPTIFLNYKTSDATFLNYEIKKKLGIIALRIRDFFALGIVRPGI